MVKWKKNKIPNIDRRVYFCSAVPVEITTALDMAASNASYIDTFLHHHQSFSSDFFTVLPISL